MGASESIPRELTHQRLYELTHDTRAMMNMILQYMLKEVTVKDFLALSNPNECKKYVVFMANTLHKYFYELQVQPVRDRGGVIAFRSIRDLVAPSPELDRERQSLCLVLAYYYTRIFQIYGALALTLIDDISTMRETGIMTDGPQRGLVAPGQRPVIYGGALTDAELGRFVFLKSFLLDEKTIRGWRTKFREQNGLYGEVFFAIKRDNTDGSDPLAVPTIMNSQKGIFTFGYEGAQRFSTIDLRVERVVSPTETSNFKNTGAKERRALLVTFENLQYAKKGETALTGKEIPSTYFTKALPLLYPVTTSNGQIAYMFRDTTRSVNEMLQDSLYRIMRFTKTLAEEGRVLEKVSEVTEAKTEAVKVPQAEVLKELSMSEERTMEGLRLGKILHNLTQTKPYGHCIARALQLLDNVPYRGYQGISHICKAKFLEVTGTTDKGTSTRYTRSGIPEPGSALTTSPGLFALSLLFYDTIAIGTPKLAINQKPGPTGKSSLEQYTEFIKRMATYYGDLYVSADSKEVRSDDSLRETGLSGIRNRRDQALCKGYSEDISIPYDTAVQVHRVIQSLFQEQLEHAAVCGKIFRMLFDLRREGATGRIRISLHENILQQGVPEINRINFVARQQLMKYYSNCEVKYLSGMKLVIDAKRKEIKEAAEAKRQAAIPAQIESVSRFLATAPKYVPASQAAVERARARGELPPFVPPPPFVAPAPAPSVSVAPAPVSVVAPAPVSVAPAPAPSAPASVAASKPAPIKKVFVPAKPPVAALPSAAPKPTSLPAASLPAATLPAAPKPAPIKKVFAPAANELTPVTPSAPAKPVAPAPIKKVFTPAMAEGLKKFMEKPVLASKSSIAAAMAKKTTPSTSVQNLSP